MTDPISDMLARIRNATLARQARVEMPSSRLKVEIARILESEGYIQGLKVIDAQPGERPQALLRVFLKYGPRGERATTFPRCLPVSARAS
jgi:small subunit ribosomal protein S8